MSQEEAEKILKELESYVAETTTDSEKARAALFSAGLITEDGEPEEIYKN